MPRRHHSTDERGRRPGQIPVLRATRNQPDRTHAAPGHTTDHLVLCYCAMPQYVVNCHVPATAARLGHGARTIWLILGRIGTLAEISSWWSPTRMRPRKGTYLVKVVHVHSVAKLGGTGFFPVEMARLVLLSFAAVPLTVHKLQPYEACREAAARLSMRCRFVVIG